MYKTTGLAVTILGMLVFLFATGQSVNAQTFSIVPSTLTSLNAYNTSPLIVSVNDGNYVIAYKSTRSGQGYSNVFVQRIDKFGNRLWERDGVAVAPNAAAQDNIKLVHDGFGGVIVVWEDSREGLGNKKIYMQRVNVKGEVMWGATGTRICEADGEQRNPEVMFDRKNGFFVVWEDSRHGVNEIDLYARHINLAGKMNWTDRGIAVVRARGAQRNAKLTTDDEHGVIVIWEDFRNGLYWNLFAQKIDRKGNHLWPSHGLDIFAGVMENQHEADIVSDGYGGFVFVYQKFSEQTAGYDIYRGRIQNSGELAWHHATCEEKENQTKPRLVKKGSDAIIVWEDERNGNSDIYSQMVSIQTGLFKWAKEGKPVCSDAGDENNVTLVSTIASNTQMFIWERTVGNNSILYAQKLDNYGNPQWETNGMRIATSEAGQNEAVAVPDEQGGMIVAWADLRELNASRIFIQRLNGNGLPLMNKKGLKIEAEHKSVNAEIKGLKVLPSRRGEFFVVWEDGRNGKENTDIYMQKLDRLGNPVWRQGGISICSMKGNQERPILVEDGVGGVFITWIDFRDTEFDAYIYSQRINPDGLKQWKADGVPVTRAKKSKSQVKMVSDGKEGVVVCWVDTRYYSQTGFDIYVQRVNYTGTAMWGENGKVLAREAGIQTSPSMAGDDEGGAFIAWMDDRNGYANIFMQHLNSYGINVWEQGGRRINTVSWHQRSPQIGRNFRGDLYLAWQDAGAGDGNEKVLINLLTARGIKLWGEKGINVSTTFGAQTKPRLRVDADGNAFVTWLDARGSNSDVRMYAQKFNIGGEIQWEENGVPIGKQMEMNNDFEMILNPGGYSYFFWNATEGVNENKRVFYQKLRPDGLKKLNMDGVTVGDGRCEQECPVMSINNESRVLVCWVSIDASTGAYRLEGEVLTEQ